MGLMLCQQYFSYMFITEPRYSMSPGGIASTNYFFVSNWQLLGKEYGMHCFPQRSWSAQDTNYWPLIGTLNALQIEICG